MKFLLVSPKNRTIYNFRGDLIREIVSLGYQVVATGPNFHNIEHIDNLGIEFKQITVEKNGTSIFGDLRYFLRLVKLMRQQRPDVVLSYTIKPSIYGSISAKIAGVKNINAMVTGLGYVFAGKSLKVLVIRALVSLLTKMAFYCTDRVIFQNRDDQQEYINRRLVKASKTEIVNGSGINMSRFSRKPKPETLAFLMLARALFAKGTVEYLQAAQVIKAKYPEVRLMFLGAVEDIQDSIPKELMMKYVSKGIIEYFEETDDVRPVIEQCSVFVLPSYREGTPRSVLEAMSMGRPVITTNVPGCKETVIEGETGFVVPEKSVISLVEAMEKFVINPTLVDQMGNQSWQYCKERFDVDIVNNNMLTIMRIVNV